MESTDWETPLVPVCGDIMDLWERVDESAIDEAAYEDWVQWEIEYDW